MSRVHSSSITIISGLQCTLKGIMVTYRPADEVFNLVSESLYTVITNKQWDVSPHDDRTILKQGLHMLAMLVAAECAPDKGGTWLMVDMELRHLEEPSAGHILGESE